MYVAKPKDVIVLNLNFKEATLEHIIPQTPDPSTNWVKDFSKNFRQKYTYKLGNMTLLTQPMNSGAKNYDFGVKKEIYKKTKLALTLEVAQLHQIDETFIKDRHSKITNYLIQHFNL